MSKDQKTDKQKEAEAKKAAAEKQAAEAKKAAEKAKKDAEAAAAKAKADAEKAKAKAEAEAKKAAEKVEAEKAKAAKAAEKEAQKKALQAQKDATKAARDAEREAKRAQKAAEREARKNQPRVPRVKPWEDMAPGGVQQAPREGSVLHTTLELMKANKGATIEEIQAAIGDKHNARRLLTWANRERGYGFTMTKTTQKITALAPNVRQPAPKAEAASN